VLAGIAFLRNALDYLPRNADNDCMTEPGWIYGRRSIGEARQELAAWLRKWTGRRNADALSPAATASQKLKIDESAGAVEPGDESSDAGSAHVPQRGRPVPIFVGSTDAIQ